MPESADDFLALFPHRYDYIYASHSDPCNRPQWQTESRHPLSDRLFHQGAYLFGVRFSSQTHYCLLDIDVGSPYHPEHDPFAIPGILDALEPLGLINHITCTSSYSQGLHLYFPFETVQESWKLSAAMTALLESRGYKCKPGQLEIFPNRKLYAFDETPSLFNAHRLPLQAGSYLLNSQFEPIFSSHEEFVRQWLWCQRQNTVEVKAIEKVLKQKKRHHHRVSERANKFLNDLNAEIEGGWTDKGQTNYLLGRVTMRCYIFHHMLYGGSPLTGGALVNEIVSVAIALPGYREWCNHQHEIYERAEEWARCIENSHYFPYGTQSGKYKAKATNPRESGTAQPPINWNQRQSKSAQAKIEAAVTELFGQGQLLETATARFKQLLTYGIGGSTLYKYKSLWHPDLWKTPQTPQYLRDEEGLAMASPANPSHPPSLLSTNGSNPSQDNALGDRDVVPEIEAGRNSDPLVAWRQVLANLKEQQKHQRTVRLSQSKPQLGVLSEEKQRVYAKRMENYLRSREPILMKEALNWLIQQEDSPLWHLLSIDIDELPGRDQHMEALLKVFQVLLKLRWSPTEICQSLKAQFGKGEISGLSFEELSQWGMELQKCHWAQLPNG